jgi:predicted site-specific integrase-resolvase
MRADEIARAMGISRGQIYRFIREEKIVPVVPVRRNRLFDFGNFVKVLKSRAGKYQ